MTKCFTCKRKINKLMVDVYQCKCKNIYCTEHINNHNCTFDYHNKHKEIIKDNLPLVTFGKLTDFEN